MAKKKSKTGKMLKKMKGTSNLEVVFAELLTENNVIFKQHYIFKGKEFDFLLTDYNILIELHGCFYHCCKLHHPVPKYTLQRKNLKNDQHKVKIVKFDLTYNLLIIWEHEMSDSKKVVKKLNEFIFKYKNLING